MTAGDAARIRRLHSEAIVIDGMNNARMTGGYFRSMMDGGITATMIPVTISAPFRQTIDQLGELLKLVDENSDRVHIIRRAPEIEEAKRQGKLGLILALEDTRQLEDDLNLIRIYWELGIRRMQLVHRLQNTMGAGKAERHDSGLTRFGVQAIERMEKVGMLVDLSHCPPKMLSDAMEVVTRPVVLSHSNVKAVFDNPYNLSDDQIEMVARNGGVIGISGLPYFVAEREPTIDNVMDHIAHVEKRVGIDHVGIGLAIFEGHPASFYDQRDRSKDAYPPPPWTWPQGIETIALFPNLTHKLVERGYSEGAIKKILGGNFLRVFKEIWG
ncbi:MAG: membrane dipeptidase [Chloroflexi bacterium]|nr:membrane dipeptidase [Chloroflexota bacterium]